MSGATSVTATRPARTQLPRFLPFAAWASFVLNVLIIATGGAVRLTGSGLGCTEWPLCTPGSLVPTEELSYHALIEFGNRTISGPLLLAALAVVILTWRIRAERKDLSVLSWLVLGLVLLQAVVGGFIVWEELAAVLVGFHYTVSLIIVCIAAAYLARMYERGGARERAVPKGFAILTHVTTLAMAIVIIMGVITTANGPHSGDENVVRDGFDATFLSHLHAWPGYVTFALVVTLVAWAYSRKLRPLPWTMTLLAVLVVQILVGVYQARNGLPPVLVGVHMVLAALTAATTTVTVLRLKRPVAE
ncbi:COX15/CtaA family protein [Leucobacter aridicollis]|uniref:Cytochrome c oxidase assembly protein subunit 15 n=1 Tax=Leucobacter aridicollis TaxID=283878 RepID=A0A852R730_9MICO|nr:COX15/CtaA family protein [Leucobacter aridicollis]MBL3683673.1 heme A synthase [Leucobacter aridicollis]NYD26718.1 cytochrome c oxidase assembly protein subunit 15 [Leucobacter aridicollis]